MSPRRPKWAVAALLLPMLVPACSSSDLPPGEARSRAATVWETRCRNCHGPTGDGDGPGALVLDVKPRALSDPAWQASVTDEHIAKVIVQGGKAAGLSIRMPGNPDLEDQPQVVDALVKIVRELSAAQAR